MPNILHLEVPPPVKRGPGRPPLAPEIRAARKQQALQAEVASSTPVDQARAIFRAGNRLSALVGLVMGGFVPLACYSLIHLEVSARPELWLLVAGGLVYSAFNMLGWMQRLLKNFWMALGWVVLVEGTMTACHILWLSVAGLAILILLDGITMAINITLPKPREE